MERKLSIVIVLPSIITKNGTAKQSLELARELVKRGNNVEFATYAYLKKGSFEDFKDFKIHYRIDVTKSFFFKRTKSLVRLERIYLYIALLNIFSFRKLLFQHKYDIINPHDWFGLWVSFGNHDKANLIVHVNDVPNRLEVNIISRIKLFFDRWAAKSANGFIVLDNKNREGIIKWLGVSKEKVYVVRSGIDADKFKKFNKTINIRKMFKFSPTSTVFACANLLARNRRYEEVIEAIYRIKKYKKEFFNVIILSKLDFDPLYANFLSALIKEKELDQQVIFVDKYFKDEERMAFIKSCDALVFPNYPQTWGLTVLEAMALGTPVIVSRGSGVSEVLHNQIDALLYREGDINELAQKMTEIQKSNKSVIRMKKKARDSVFREFTWTHYAANIEEVYRRAKA